uniref:Galectin domain-containing protein n=1 Tax=Aureoumbra lagunensis TaxID=44058 RepID=A0A7S3K6B2_9STRA|mmetsp:Transcript_7918/g.12039  ORF Transcript_7918/g.12039 Transcript_7918/m.12039 type:complete len:425 (+) Transcript_7918:6-1280(+)
MDEYSSRGSEEPVYTHLQTTERMAVLKLYSEEEANRRRVEFWTQGWEDTLYEWRHGISIESGFNETPANDSLTESEKALIEAYSTIGKERAAEEEVAFPVSLKPMKEALVTKRLVMPNATKPLLPKMQQQPMTTSKPIALGISSAVTAVASHPPTIDKSRENEEKPSAASTNHSEQQNFQYESIPKRAKKAINPEMFSTVRSSAPDGVDAVWNDSSTPPPETGTLKIDVDPPWISTSSTERFFPCLELPRYGTHTTLVLQVSVDTDALRWALNLCPKLHDDAANILLHLNARRVERGGILVLNDKLDDNWNRDDKVPLSNFPLSLFSLDNDTLIIQLHVEHNQLFVDLHIKKTPIVRWRSRLIAPPYGADLALLVPTADDFGNPESITIHSAWWGWHAPLPPPNESSTYRAGGGAFRSGNRRPF